MILNNFNFTIDVSQDSTLSSDGLSGIETIQKAAPAGLNTSDRPGRSYFDGFRKNILPSRQVLVQEYKRLAYTCANLNAGAVSCAKLKLFVKKETTSQKSLLRKGIETKPVSRETLDWLLEQSYLSKTLHSFVEIEEVVRHPVLDLLDRVNDSKYANSQRNIEITQLYQEITGKAYWRIENDPIFNMPMNIWLLPTQFITPVKRSRGNETIVDFYEYRPPTADEPTFYRPDEIIDYLFASLTNPYVDGLSPLEAAFDASEVNNKLLSHQDAFLENHGMPSVILSPDKDSEISADEAEALERKYQMKFSRGRDGKVMVLESDMSLLPVTFKPGDLARLEINKWSKNDLANAFQVPYALISDTNNNRQQLEAAEAQHARHGIKARLQRDAAVKNKQLLTRYDNTGRLFFAYDDPVPEDQEKKLQENVQLTMNGIITPNEARKEYNRKPLPDGDELRAINVSPEIMRQQRADQGNDGRTKDTRNG